MGTDHNLLANVAAISGDLHSNAGYSAFYKAWSDNLGGFVGIYDAVIDAAKALTAWEVAHPHIYDETDWIWLIEVYTMRLVASRPCGLGGVDVATELAATLDALGLPS